VSAEWPEIEKKLLNHSYLCEWGSDGSHVYTSWLGHRKIHPIFTKQLQKKNPGGTEKSLVIYLRMSLSVSGHIKRVSKI
jgi:hypothetical protein